MDDAHAGGGEGLVTRAGGVEFALVGDGVGVSGGHCYGLMPYVVDFCDYGGAGQLVFLSFD